jgi:MraZ protein
MANYGGFGEVYTGYSTVAIDSKGRTNLPRELRRELPVEADGKVVVVPGPGPTLYCFDAPAFDRTVRSLQALPRTPELAKNLRRMTTLAATSVLDEQNRLTLPPRLMEIAGLSGKVTFAGDGDKIILMTPERFETEIGGLASTSSYDEFSECLQVPPPGWSPGRAEPT